MEIKPDSVPEYYRTIDASIEGLKKILRHEGDEAIRYIEEKAKVAGVDVRKWIMEGQPAKEILKLAEGESVDLIVMGTLGKSGIEKFLLGSVADKVIRGSKIPVLVVRK